MSISEKNPNMDVEDSHADKLAVNKHMDKAAQFMAETEEYPLMRKVDWIMIPIVSPSESHY
jgi:hypothetical protein